MAKTKSWKVSDKFWKNFEPLIPAPQRAPNKEYKRKVGGGRKPRRWIVAVAHSWFKRFRKLLVRARNKTTATSPWPRSIGFCRQQSGKNPKEACPENVSVILLQTLRCEKKACAYIALTHLAAVIIAFRKSGLIYE